MAPMRQVMRSRVSGNRTARKLSSAEAGRLGRDERCGAAVAEDKEAEHLFEFLRLLQVQRAEFEVEQQDFGCGLRTHDVARLLEAVDRRVTAHEADHRALDRGVEMQMIEDVEVEARRVQARAARDQHVRDAAAFSFA
jgi:hypothetical protein